MSRLSIIHQNKETGFNESQKCFILLVQAHLKDSKHKYLE